MIGQDERNQPQDDASTEPKLRPNERLERTDAAFREIVDREKRADAEKTERLRAARLARDAEAAKE